MNTYLKRALVASVAALSLVLMAPSMASADTGPWQWSDISDKLTARDNRPVWAIARAEPYWYLTDGQELWSGGHVWKTDGSVMSDITLDVRNAGISRVDDIVSDGQNVLYLKNVTQRNNNVEAISYNGTYTNLTSQIRQNLSSNEGIVQISGQSGTWGMITSYGRVILYTQSSNTLKTIKISNNTLPLSPYVRVQSSPVGWTLGYAMQPVQGNWLAIWQDYYGAEHFVKIDQYGNTTNLTSPINTNDSIVTMASNGQNVLIGGYRDIRTDSTFAYVYDGSSFRSIPSASMPPYWFGATVAYNGKSWMIVQDKNLYRFDGTNFQSYGQTRDYFVQTIGNGNGTFLLGGAVSNSGQNGPSSPLTAKLVRADEGVYYSNNNTTVTTNTTYTQEKLATVTGFKNRITYWAWFKPGQKYHPNNSLPFYTVGTQSNDGIKKIELYINDVYQKTCLAGNTKKNTSCSMPVNPANWPLDSNVGAFAKITSATGRVAYVPASLIRFYNANTAVTNDGSLSATMSVSNNTPYLQRGTTTNVYVSGVASEGINRIEVYANGQVKQTCSIGGTTGSCTLALNGNDYNANTVVSFNGRVVSQNGRETWTWLGQYTVTDYNTNYNYNTNSNTTLNSNTLGAAVWFDPSSTDFTTNNTKNLMAQAVAPSGLRTIEIMVNGSVKQSCSFSNVYGTQSCQVTVYGTNYSGMYNIPVLVRATDANGQQANSQTLYLNPTTSNNNYNYNYNYNNSNGSVTVSTSDSRTSYNSNETISFNGYDTDSDGIQKIELYANGSYINGCSLSNATYGTCSASVLASTYANGSTLPLQAKATDRYGNVTWSNTLNVTINNYNNNNNYNSNATVTVSTDKTTYGRNESFVLYSSASDNDGLQRLDLYANGSYLSACTLSNVSYGTCSASVLGSNFTNSSMSLSLQAKATDRYGNVAWSDTKYVTITDSNNNNSNATVTVSTSDSRTSYNSNETISFNGYDTDSDGIQKIELYANGTYVNACSLGNATYGSCSASIVGSNYASGSTLPLQAKATDRYGNVTWSNTLNVTVNGYNNNNNQNNNDVHGTITLSSNADNGYTTGQQITYTATGSDTNGIKRIEIYVGSDLVKSCDSASCSYTGGPYDAYQIIYGAKLIDQLDNTVWSGYKYIYKK
jgi:hypothetical protein